MKETLQLALVLSAVLPIVIGDVAAHRIVSRVHPLCNVTVCPAENFRECTVHLPHSDCTKFYTCDAGRKVEMDCPFLDAIRKKKLHFSPILHDCVWPEEAGCTGDTLTPHEWDCARYYKTQSGVKTEERCPAGLYFSNAQKVCVAAKLSGCTPACPPAGSKDVVSLPHEIHCSQYYECENGSKILKKCPKGYSFSIVRGECDVSAYVDCTEDDCEPEGRYPLPHESECDLYYQCDDGEKTLEKCPEGLHYSVDKQTCVLPEDAKCNRKCSLTMNHRLPHETRCDRFYQCVDGKVIEQKCPGGLHFNAVYQICLLPKEVNCKIELDVCYRDYLVSGKNR